MGASAAVIGGGLAAGAGSAAGGIMGGKGASSSAQATAQASEYATNMQYQMFQEELGLEMPFISQGTKALSEQDWLMGVGGQNAIGKKLQNQLTGQGYSYGALAKPFTQQQMFADPGYQFRLGASEDAIQSAAAAGGTYGSGTMATNLMNTAGNLASQEYSAAYGRYLQPYSMLGGLSGMGQNASSQAAGLEQATGQGMAQTTMQGAQQSALYNYLGAQQYGNALTGGLNFLGGGANNYLTGGASSGFLGQLLQGLGYGSNIPSGLVVGSIPASQYTGSLPPSALPSGGDMGIW